MPLGLTGLCWGLTVQDGRRFLSGWLLLEVEQRRLFAWIAVAFGLGILLCFAADGVPALWAPVAGALVFGTMALIARRRLVASAALIGLAALFLGFAATMLRLRAVEAPVLGRTVLSPLTGFIESLEERQEGARLVVRVHSLEAVPEGRVPARVRVTLRDPQGLSPGDFISAKARLLPPPEAARPGGYDFARDAYFRGIGAVGSISGRAVVGRPPHPPDLSLRLAFDVERARNGLTRRITDAIGGQSGAVAAALVTGKRGLIEEETNQALRAAGIYHIVSISGLHMVLAAGTMFWLVRALLALSPALALRWPVKKIAALAAMLGAIAYCVFSGSEVATERALVMTLVMLGAVLADRPALSLRNLALSALIVLAREPEALLGPSFQMSYAAVAALIAGAEWLRGRFPRGEPGGVLNRALRWAGGAALGLLATTLVATLATAPFGSFHFQTLNPFGLIGNALAVPLVSAVVMPCAVAGVLAFPFGLDRPVWSLMGFAVAQVLRVSEWIGGFGGASVLVPAFEAEALALMALGLVILTLAVSPLRFAALIPAAMGLWLAATPKRFDIYIDRDGSGAAVRGSDRRLVILGRVPAFVAEQWLKADGDARRTDDPSLRAGVRCDGLGCVAETGGRAVALVGDRRAFAEDCGRAAFIITRLPAPSGCQARVLLDRTFFAAHGATAVRLTAAGHRLETSRRPGDARPWLPRPGPGRAERAGKERADGPAPAAGRVEEEAEGGSPDQ